MTRLLPLLLNSSCTDGVVLTLQDVFIRANNPAAAAPSDIATATDNNMFTWPLPLHLIRRLDGSTSSALHLRNVSVVDLPCSQLEALQALACSSLSQDQLHTLEVVPGRLGVPHWSSSQEASSPGAAAPTIMMMTADNLTLSCRHPQGGALLPPSEAPGLIPLAPALRPVTSSFTPVLQRPAVLPPASACAVGHIADQNWRQLPSLITQLQVWAAEVHLVLHANLTLPQAPAQAALCSAEGLTPQPGQPFFAPRCNGTIYIYR
jgi:hypothetical protein